MSKSLKKSVFASRFQTFAKLKLLSHTLWCSMPSSSAGPPECTRLLSGRDFDLWHVWGWSRGCLLWHGAPEDVWQHPQKSFCHFHPEKPIEKECVCAQCKWTWRPLGVAAVWASKWAVTRWLKDAAQALSGWTTSREESASKAVWPAHLTPIEMIDAKHCIDKRLKCLYWKAWHSCQPTWPPTLRVNLPWPSLGCTSRITFTPSLSLAWREWATRA